MQWSHRCKTNRTRLRHLYLLILSLFLWEDNSYRCSFCSSGLYKNSTSISFDYRSSKEQTHTYAFTTSAFLNWSNKQLRQ